MMFVGRIQGESVYVAPEAANNHVLVTGVSGSGKTFRLGQIEQACVTEGKTVIAIDFNGAWAASGERQSRLLEDERGDLCYISALQNGIDMSFLPPVPTYAGEQVAVVTRVCSILAGPIRLGNCEINTLRRAVLFAMLHKADFPDEMAAITYGLYQQGTKCAESVYSKLWSVLMSGIFRKDGQKLCKKKLNVVSFAGYDVRTQRVFAELLLSNFWHYKILTRDESEEELVFVLDECQNFSFREGSICWQFLREGRKYGISLLLSTQTLANFPPDVRATLDQAATKLIFQPAVSDVRHCLKQLCTDKPLFWEKLMKTLSVGTAITYGCLAVGQTDMATTQIRYPIVTTA